MRTSTPCARPRSTPGSCAEAGSAERVQNGTAAFELRGASVVYGGRPALDDANLVVEPGEAVALVGPSGAGKTTLLRLLNASARPTRGEARLERRDLASLTPAELRSARARIGFVHQDLALVPNIRVYQNVMAGKFGSMSFLGAAKSLLPP